MNTQMHKLNTLKYIMYGGTKRTCNGGDNHISIIKTINWRGNLSIVSLDWVHKSTTSYLMN